MVFGKDICLFVVATVVCACLAVVSGVHIVQKVEIVGSKKGTFSKPGAYGPVPHGGGAPLKEGC